MFLISLTVGPFSRARFIAIKAAFMLAYGPFGPLLFLRAWFICEIMRIADDRDIPMAMRMGMEGRVEREKDTCLLEFGTLWSHSSTIV